ncbi:MAG: AAA family ATPase [Chlamydiia bacterium]|nr:AAA family ATPase [Chlamydiia bacterium]
MDSQIFGRDKEKERLKKIYQGKEAAFLAVYGRRRVGKTFLIKEFFQDKGVFFHLTGLKGEKTSTQLKGFSIELSDVFFQGKKQEIPKSWSDAMTELRYQLEKIPKDQKAILFFDELPWLASPKSGFLEALDHLWNRYLSNMRNMILIVCGSAASWMIRKVIDDRGGLHGRITHQMPLFPFTIAETQGFLEGREIFLSTMQLTELYMAIGGVAKYLTYVEKGRSAAEIINELCFQRGGPLYTEFHRLFRSLFNHYESHIAIVRALSKKRMGLTYREIAQETDLEDGGTLTGRLRELEESGFITSMSIFGKGKKERLFCLIDEYSLFYLTWIEEHSFADLDESNGNFWMRQRETSKWRAWKGFAFERICLKNIKAIKKALGIEEVMTKTSKWMYRPTNKEEKGAEIDWVMERGDGCIHLFEAKYTESDYEIKKEEAQKLREKRNIFKRETKTRKTIFTTFVTPFGVKQNTYFAEGVDQQIILEKLLEVGANAFVTSE